MDSAQEQVGICNMYNYWLQFNFEVREANFLTSVSIFFTFIDCYLFQILIEPYKYILQVPGKQVREKLIQASILS
jgi:hypothetical protein